MELNHPEDRLIDLFEDVTPLEPINMDSGLPPAIESADTTPNGLPSESSSLPSNTGTLSPHPSIAAATPGSTLFNHISGTSSCSSTSSGPTITINTESPPSHFSGHAVKTSGSTTSTVTPGSTPSRHESGTHVVLIIITMYLYEVFLQFVGMHIHHLHQYLMLFQSILFSMCLLPQLKKILRPPE